jgi:tRNA G10  N-methylase Trm11
VGWTDCGHGTPARGVVLDPFVGTGTTLRTAVKMGFDAVGVDLAPLMSEQIEALDEESGTA